jgi:hypothetical protein
MGERQRLRERQKTKKGDSGPEKGQKKAGAEGSEGDTESGIGPVAPVLVPCSLPC